MAPDYLFVIVIYRAKRDKGEKCRQGKMIPGNITQSMRWWHMKWFCNHIPVTVALVPL